VKSPLSEPVLLREQWRPDNSTPYLIEKAWVSRDVANKLRSLYFAMVVMRGGVR
jgi:hypothetical protein